MEERPIILIVDDDAAARELAEARLGESGYRLETASDGRAALERAAELRPDLVLLDVMMPELDGFEVCRRLRADPRLAEVPVVMITALGDAESRQRGLTAGADDFVTKPYDGGELEARVATIVRLDRYRRLHAERLRFEWVVESSDDGYLQIDDDDLIVYANPKARRYLELDDGVGEARFLATAARRFRCEPEASWASWPRCDPGPLYLLRPESRAAGAFWLRVDVREPSGAGGNRLLRLRDESSQMAVGRKLWKFGSLVAHKLHTPLTMVLGSLEMLARDATRFTEKELRELSALALRSGLRLRDQVDNILEALDQSEIDQREGGFDLDRLGALVEELAAEVDVGPVDLRLGDAGLTGRVSLSPLAFELVLRELFANARSFHPDAAPTLSLDAAVVSGSTPGRLRLRLSLRADGATVPADELARMWVPYYQTQTGLGSTAGTGLGLSMAGALIWSLGGTFRIVNRDGGEGFVAELTLPVAGRLGGSGIAQGRLGSR